MSFMTSDGMILVSTAGLGCHAYEQRDNPMSSCPPFSFKRLRFYNSRWKIHVTVVWLSYVMKYRIMCE
ncbi:hypothetical protein Hanom_Chr10g00919241 [Helianthus anomalus]